MPALVQNLGIHLSWLKSSNSNKPQGTFESSTWINKSTNKLSTRPLVNGRNQNSQVSTVADTIPDSISETIIDVTPNTNSRSSGSLANNSTSRIISSSINGHQDDLSISHDQPVVQNQSIDHDESRDLADLVYLSDTDESIGPSFTIASDHDTPMDENEPQDREIDGHSVLDTITSSQDPHVLTPKRHENTIKLATNEEQNEANNLLFSCQQDLIGLLEKQVKLLRGHCILEDSEQKELENIENDVNTTKGTLQALIEVVEENGEDGCGENNGERQTNRENNKDRSVDNSGKATGETHVHTSNSDKSNENDISLDVMDFHDETDFEFSSDNESDNHHLHNINQRNQGHEQPADTHHQSDNQHQYNSKPQPSHASISQNQHQSSPKTPKTHTSIAVLGSSPSITALRQTNDDLDDIADFEDEEQVIESSDIGFEPIDQPEFSDNEPEIVQEIDIAEDEEEDLGVSLSDFSEFDSDIEQTGYSVLEEPLINDMQMQPPPLPVFTTPAKSTPTISNISPENAYSQIQFSEMRSDVIHPWTTKVEKVLHETFKLDSFRGNQLKAINATLDKKDVLVLMPTGGGKSLCYQLPALIDEGITIVISPLISLMQDQIAHLTKRKIRARLINSRCNLTERNETFNQLAAGDIDLLYISPEMLQASERMERELSNLYNAGLLTRLVIDEAHCVSSWGHDFRPDYKSLANMKRKFPNTPIMALTATANERVRLDILKCLRPEKTVLFQQSFNRTNLFYEVLKKNGKSAINQTVEFIRKYPSQCGIIYCNSKITCEQTAENLRKHGISAEFYHAGLGADERHSIQERWQLGKFQVICATIAFGMGIDKPDVRFVIHYSLPRTMEGYYQETGRAGRDGKPSHCVLFYAYKDATNISMLIDKEESITNKDHQKQLLKRVVQYCENRADCRRQQVLQYFNEKFDSAQCHKSCDNCKDGACRTVKRKDITEIAKEIIQLVSSIQNNNLTVLQCVDIYRGFRNKKITELSYHLSPMFGKGKKIDRTELDRIFHHLISENILKEYSHYNRAGFAQSYVKNGPNARSVLAGGLKVTMNVYIEKGGRGSVGGSSVGRSSVGKSAGGSSVGATRKKRSSSIINIAETTTKTSTTSTKTKPISSNKRPKTNNWEKEEEQYAEMELIREDVRSRLEYRSSQEVCSDESLRQIAKELPANFDDFKKMKGLSAVQAYKMYKYFRPVLVRLRQESEAKETEESSEAQAYTSKHFSSSSVKSTVQTDTSRAKDTGGSKGISRKSTANSSTGRGIRAMPV